ncbi:MAG: RNA polymerase factor sigma-54 [Chitinophagaceae bacterium]|nr:RNA polymerase factor sigma-54 [Rubrivivax sp.]
MKPSLQVRLSQHLALTPQLQQSIRLLQLSTLELHQEVEQMLEQNPFLEAEDEAPANNFDTPADRQSVDRLAEREGDEGAEAHDGGETVAEIRADEFGTSEREDWENGTEGDDFDGIRETPGSGAASGSGDGDGDQTEAHDRRAEAGSLQDHLRAQLLGMRLADDDRAALWVLIESLNGDGYLADPLEEIADRLAEMLEQGTAASREELLERLNCALRWLQSMEPQGVGARSLGECLTLQIRSTPKCAARQVALRICDQYLELLARRDMRRLTALTGASEELVREAQALIVACEPKPGRPFASVESNTVVPDVIVRKNGRGLSVVLNPDVMPKLRINDLYAQAVRGSRGSNGQPGLGSRLQEARWFMKNIQQRFDTILRVSKAIVERQKSFFSHGAIAMKPLVLREIADELGLHESTISRVTTAKYMATIHGTFELKYFFGSSLNTDAGGNASSTAVRALIQQLVAAEDMDKPLSDSQLSLMLEEQGIQVARRTVAKYREALKIAPASLRKTM